MAKLTTTGTVLAATIAVASISSCAFDPSLLLAPGQTSAQHAAPPSLAVEVADEDGRPVPLTRESIRSVQVDGRTLDPAEFEIRSGEIRFLANMGEGPRPRPVRIELHNGLWLEGASLPPRGPRPPKAMFVPGADGKMHVGDPDRSLHDNFQMQRDRDRQHRVRIPLTVAGKPLAFGIRRAGSAETAPLPRFAFDLGPNGLEFDVQVLNLAAKPALGLPANPSPGNPSPGNPSPGSPGSHGPGNPGPGPAQPGPGKPAQATPDDLRGATFVLVAEAAYPKVTVTTFGLLKTDLAQQDPATMALPPAQALMAADITSPTVATYDTLDAALREERLPKSPPPPLPPPPPRH